MTPTLFIVSVAGGFFSGLLGVGGAVILIPLLLYVPPWVGVGQLTIHQVAGITMVQVLAATMAGFFVHRRGGFAHLRTIVTVGAPMGMFALIGAAVSKTMDASVILLIFGSLLIIALAMLLMPQPSGAPDIESKTVVYKPVTFGLVGCAVGWAAGIVGAGGGFILIPLMIRILKLPIRVIIGSSLGILFLGALAGAIGKSMTMQVPWPYLAPVIAGSIPAALIGARISRAIPTQYIRYALITVVCLTMLKTWYDIITQW